jgi:polysaccharide biosynthesis transport protein
MADLPYEAEHAAPADRKQVAPAAAGPSPALMRDPYGVPGYGGYPEVQGDNIAFSLQRYLRIFLKHKWLILGIAFFLLAIGGLYALLKTPRYTATVSIQIDREPMKVLEGGSTAPAVSGQDNLEFQRTQFELLKSRAMAERVVTALHLQDDEDLLKPQNVSALGWLRTVFSSEAQEDTLAAKQAMAVEIVTDNIDIRPVTGSRLVNLHFTDPSATRAQRIANAYADAYVSSNLDKRFEANSYAKVFLDDQIKQLKIRLEESEKALLDFAEREKIVQVNDKTSIAENNLAAANVSLGQIVSERIKNEQSWQQVENATAINLPQLLSSSVIDGLRSRRNDLQRDYEEKLETFKPSYPAMVEISTKIKEVDRQLATEVSTIKASLKAAFEASLHQEGEMKKQIEQLRAEVLDLQKKGIQHNILKREVETNRGLYNSLLQRYKEVDVASGIGTNNIFIVDRALTPITTSEPRIARVLLLALAIGLSAGLAAAYFMELFDDRVRSPADVEQISGLSTLGIIPLVREETAMASELSDPRSAISEAYRALATVLQFSTETGLPRSIVVTSSGPSEGKSSTALAIARHFATLGMKVLLVDADMRKPSLHTKMGHESAIGLSNYLTGAATPPQIVQHTDNPNLTFIASGPLPPNAGDLLGGTRIFSMLSVGAEVFDLIVLDSPPLLGLADAQLLASAAAATIFVAGAGQSRKGMIKSGLRRLQLARVTPIGIVLTKFDNKVLSYGYEYGYGYGYTYQPDANGRSTPLPDGDARSRKPKLAQTAAE